MKLNVAFVIPDNAGNFMSSFVMKHEGITLSPLWCSYRSAPCTLRLELGAIRGAIKIIKEVYSVGQDSLLSSFSIIPLAFLEYSCIK